MLRPGLHDALHELLKLGPGIGHKLNLRYGQLGGFSHEEKTYANYDLGRPVGRSA